MTIKLLSVSSGVVRDDNQKTDHDGGLAEALQRDPIGPLTECMIVSGSTPC
jgi:hypothetical protein